MKTKTQILGLVLVLLGGLIPSFLHSEEGISVKGEQELAKYFESQMNCKKTGKGDPGKGEANFFCNLQFRGLNLDISGVNSLKGGTIYINSLGKTQLAYMLGGRCMVVTFADPDLREKGDLVGVVFNNNGNITALSDGGGRGKCY